MFGKENFKILVVEDDSYFNKILVRQLNKLCNGMNYSKVEFEIIPCYSSAEMLENLDRHTDLILLDHYIDEGINDGSATTGIQLMDTIKKKCKNCKVVVVSGQQEISTTAEFFKKGAEEYVEKDDHTAERIWSIVERMLKGKKKVA